MQQDAFAISFIAGNYKYILFISMTSLLVINLHHLNE
jgi:hypothetical protein